MSLKDPIRYSSSVLAEPWSRKKLGTSGTTIARLLLTWSSAHLNVCCPKTVHLTLTSLTELLPRIAGVRSTLHKCKDKLFVNIFSVFHGGSLSELQLARPRENSHRMRSDLLLTDWSVQTRHKTTLLRSSMESLKAMKFFGPTQCEDDRSRICAQYTEVISWVIWFSDWCVL